VDKTTAGVPANLGIPPLGSVPSATGLQISQSTAMTVSAVYSCVTRIAVDVARCNLGLYFVGDRSSGPLSPRAHPLAKLLLKPNRVQTRFEFLEQLVVSLLLRANGYAVALYGKKGEITEILPVNPDAVMTLEAPDGQIFYNVNRIGLFQNYMLHGYPASIPADNVFHVRGLSFNVLVGASVIGLARDAIGVAMGLEQQASRWLGAGARPSVLLKSKTMLTDEAVARLKASWNDYVSGLQNVGSTLILEEGLEPQTLSLSGADLQFIEQRGFQIADIARFWHMPLHKLGIVEKGAMQNLSEQDQIYVNECVAPILARIEEKMNYFFLLDSEKGVLEFRFDTDPLLRAAQMTRASIARTLVVSGIATPNEGRVMMNLPERGDGEELLRPSNLAVFGSDITGSAPDGAGRPPEGEAPDTGAVANTDAAGEEGSGEDAKKES